MKKRIALVERNTRETQIRMELNLDGSGETQVGGGGKTSAMFRLAGEFKAAGSKVLVTTTTNIGVPGPGHPVFRVPLPGARSTIFGVRRKDIQT